ncbi:hypothetical protein ACJX0J_020374, partial [Zea mays]
FGEGSPERKAAINLQHFFNYIAVSIVLAQLESYNREAYLELKEFISRTSLNDAEIFCEKLMRESPRLKGLALRILEVRSAYVKNEFEWDNLKELSFKYSINFLLSKISVRISEKATGLRRRGQGLHVYIEDLDPETFDTPYIALMLLN